MGKDSEGLGVNRVRQVLPEFVERLWDGFIALEAQIVPRQQSRYTRASPPVGAFAPYAGFPLNTHHSANGIVELGTEALIKGCVIEQIIGRLNGLTGQRHRGERHLF